LPSHGLAAAGGRKILYSQEGEMRKKPKITIYYPRKWIVTQGGGACPRTGDRIGPMDLEDRFA